jgi:hypothetical protein
MDTCVTLQTTGSSDSIKMKLLNKIIYRGKKRRGTSHSYRTTHPMDNDDELNM